ncbi:MAG: magnesium-translocating P-type ATPase [Betaproteobacteria bacterium]
MSDQPTAATSSDEAFWRSSEAELLSRLGTTAAGLSGAEAADRLRTGGRNVVAEPARHHILGKILRRLIDPLIAILIVAAIVSATVGDLASGAIILAILTASIGLEVTQEHGAEKAVEALKHSVAVHAAVRRDGRSVETPVEEIVSGDIVELAAGDLIPADGIILEAAGAQANEALLTGEAFPVDKRRGPCVATEPPAAFNALFSGTVLVRGTALMLVTATGNRTRFGGIAAALESAPPQGSLERGLHAFGVLIMRLTGFMVLFVLLAHLASARPVIESFLFAVALAVGMTPELLPMIMTVTLSRGAVRMAARKVVVKRLAAIHDVGAMTVLCTDKTGTLTQAKIALVGYPGIDGADNKRVLELAAVNSAFESKLRSPLDNAILAGTTVGSPSDWRYIADVPFDFDRRRASVLAEKGGRRLLIVKGASEDILALSTQVETGEGAQPLDGSRRAALEKLYQDKSAQGLRSIAVAWREFPATMQSVGVADEAQLVFAGFCLFVDPPKETAAAAIKRLEGAGIRVKVISGDAAPTVKHLVETLGIPARGLLTGADIANLGATALASQAEKTDLFARISPDQKTRIIRALQASGHTVGFIGDGINDAPALHAADVGLAVEGATEVARAAADMIMLEADLGVVYNAVEEGRRTYANIMKYLRMGTSSNFGNMLSMAVASVFIPFLPLTPIQVLLNNLLYDLSEIGIPYDTVERSTIRRPHGLEMSELLRFTLIMGPLSSVFDIAAFLILLHGFHATPEIFRTAWFIESMATQILVIFLIRTSAPFWKGRPHRILIVTSLGALAVAFAFALTPVGAPFGFVPPGSLVLLMMAVLVVGYLTAAELLKHTAMAHRPRRHGPLHLPVRHRHRRR